MHGFVLCWRIPAAAVGLAILIIINGECSSSTDHHHLLINCGSSTGEVDGKEWLGDTYPRFSSSGTNTLVQLKGLSTRSTADAAAGTSREPIQVPVGDHVPYQTARISRSRFSYIFPTIGQGQKFIRLHFRPSSYEGGHRFKRYDDLFTVEAGPFTLMSNFSASLTADAAGVVFLVKEFCIIVDGEDQQLHLTFTPALEIASSQSRQKKYAFVNGIEIISLPAGLPYCHSGDVGIQVVSDKSVVYIDNTTALEMVYSLNVKQDYSTPSVDAFRGLFGLWARFLLKDKANQVKNITWKVPVNVGFRYLVRLHFCELGLEEMAESGHNNFEFFINNVIADTSGDILNKRDEADGIIWWYRNYLVIMQGRKQDGERDILISVQSKDELSYRYFPIEGFEIFKLSNHDNSLASPNPLPPSHDSPSWTIRSILLFMGLRNAIATGYVIITCLLSIIVHRLRLSWETDFIEEETVPSRTRDKRLCRHFSLAEVLSATKNFNESLVIGKGGFGRVYQGLIDNRQQTVAMKRLKYNSKQGEREFWTEIETLSELRHVNLVSLIGYCNEQKEMVLVYEYLSNGNLADHLYKLAMKSINCSPLSWKQRLEICIGAGRGLDYLHTGHQVVHRDVKSTNILLDENFVAKVSDFGMAKAEIRNELQSQASTNLKGTFGYFDPDYFRTRKLTMKSDTYSFGVVLLEVLCGRPAVDPWVEEDKRSLTMWATDQIRNGQIYQIIDPILRGKISLDSLRSFLSIVERCLLDDPKKRPPMSHIVIKLEFALELQENKKSLVPSDISIGGLLSYTDKMGKENLKSFTPDERQGTPDFGTSTDRFQQENGKSPGPSADVMQHTDKNQDKTLKGLLSSEMICAVDPLPLSDKAVSSVSMHQTSTLSSNMKNGTSSLEDPTSSKTVNGEFRSGKEKTAIHKLSRLWPWHAPWNRAKPSKRKDFAGTSISAPIFNRGRNKAMSGISMSQKPKPSAAGGSHELVPAPNLRIFSLSELKAATRNFRRDMIIGEGGFGIVFKGYIKEKFATKIGTRSIVAVKKLSVESAQGFAEWKSEVNFLGRLTHPNLVRLLGYCREDGELMLVYEFIEKGSLENHLYRGGPYQPLPWGTRLKILMGAARGLAFLHGLEMKVIYRDFKSSNILLDGSYCAKLSDFGLAKLGPTASYSHVSTQVMGTYGYAAPEYVATGHLYVKSDIYGFGVILLEMLTGLRTLDWKRPTEQQNLVDWIKPQLLSKKRVLNNIMDPCLEGGYPSKSAFQLAQLALSCLANEPKARPSAQEIVEVLERMELASEDKPREPRVRFR